MFVLSTACLKSVCVCVCVCLAGGGEGDSKTLMSCTPPLSLCFSLSPSPWSLAGSRCHGNAHIAAGWLEWGALVEKESKRGKRERERERDHCRGRGGQARIGSPIHYPYNTSLPTNPPPLPPPPLAHPHHPPPNLIIGIGSTGPWKGLCSAQ